MIISKSVSLCWYLITDKRADYSLLNIKSEDRDFEINSTIVNTW